MVDLNEITIDDTITQSLVVDFDMPESMAIDTFFQSDTYGKLVEKTTKLYLKPWQEIYEILKKELNM